MGFLNIFLVELVFYLFIFGCPQLVSKINSDFPYFLFDIPNNSTNKPSLRIGIRG